MKFFSAKAVTTLTFLAIGITLAAEEEHEHGGHICGCEAEELGFEIDCTNQDVMLDALKTLQDNNCVSDCGGEDGPCFKSFLIVQSHHDHCLHGEVPEEVEDNFHGLEKSCREFECLIGKKYDADLPDCPPSKCDDSGNNAHAELKANGCEADCSTEICSANYKILRSEHDNCAEDTLTLEAETGLHDFEELCEEQNCNALRPGLDDEQTECHDSAAPKTTTVASAAALAALLGGAMLA